MKKIQIDFEHKNCSAEIYVNGIPIRKYNDSDQPFVSIPLTYYRVDGINEIELLVNPGDSPSTARFDEKTISAAGVYASVRLVEYPLGVYPKDPSGKVLVEVMYQGTLNERASFPKSVKAAVDLGRTVGRWAWQDAEDLKLDKSTTTEITEVIREIHKAWGDGDGKTIIKRAKIRWDDGDKIAKRSIDERKKKEQQFIEEMKEGPEQTPYEWIMEPFDPSTFDLRVVAGGKMVQAIDKNYKPIVRTKPIPSMDGFVVDYPMFLSRIKGEWYIVR